jgi:glycine/D-amino acid oxidase-like deaminating enzyme
MIGHRGRQPLFPKPASLNVEGNMSPAPQMAQHSLWQATAKPAFVGQQLAGTVDCQTVIIGGGYTGLSTALHLAERGHEVVVIEGHEPGHGGSGRNGGQIIPGIRHFTDELVKTYGPDLGHRIHAFGSGDADYTFDLIKRLGIDCDLHRGGWIQAAENEVELKQGRERAAAWQKRGAPVRLLDRPEFRAMTGTDVYIGGWLDERGGSLQPLSYVRGLARAAEAAGARLFTHSPAIRITQVKGGWRAETAQGAVTAKKLLMATNALTGVLNPSVARSQLAVWSFQIATRPLNAAERAAILPGGTIVSDTRRILRYFRLDRDGRLIIGGKGTLLAPKDRGSYQLQAKMLATLYPDIAADGFEYHWGGEIGITLDRLPRLFALGDGAYAVLQDNGKGVAWCTAMGAPLADLMSGVALDKLPLVPITPPRPIPFHALRKTYVMAGNAWLRFLDMADRLR